MKPQVNEELVKRVKRIIIEAGAPMIPMSLLFEGLGYTGIMGVAWGVLVGVISAVAIEMGYEIDKFGKQIVLKKTGTNSQKGSSDKGEKKDGKI